MGKAFVVPKIGSFSSGVSSLMTNPTRSEKSKFASAYITSPICDLPDNLAATGWKSVTWMHRWPAQTLNEQP